VITRHSFYLVVVRGRFPGTSSRNTKTTRIAKIKFSKEARCSTRIVFWFVAVDFDWTRRGNGQSLRLNSMAVRHAGPFLGFVGPKHRFFGVAVLLMER
jgi:hypothetical protein